MAMLRSLALVSFYSLQAASCPLETYRNKCGNISYNVQIIQHDYKYAKGSPTRTPELCCNLCLVSTRNTMGANSFGLAGCYYWEFRHDIKVCFTYHLKGEFDNMKPYHIRNEIAKLPEVSAEEKLAFKWNLRSSLSEPLYCGEFLAGGFIDIEGVIDQFTSFFQLSRGVISAGASNTRDMKEVWKVGPFQGVEKVELHEQDCALRAIGEAFESMKYENQTDTFYNTTETNGTNEREVLWEWKAQGEEGCQLTTEPLQVVIRNQEGRMLWQVRDGYKTEWLDNKRKDCASDLQVEGQATIVDGRIFSATDVGLNLYERCLTLVSEHRDRQLTFLTAEDETEHCCVERAENATKRGGVDFGVIPLSRRDGIAFVEMLIMKSANGSWIWGSNGAVSLLKASAVAHKHRIFVALTRERKKEALWKKNREKTRKQSYSVSEGLINPKILVFVSVIAIFVLP